MFKIGDILRFEQGEPGIMEVFKVDDLGKTVWVNFIENHPYINNGFGYIVKQEDVVKDDTYLRRKKLKRLKECLK